MPFSPLQNDSVRRRFFQPLLDQQALWQGVRACRELPDLTFLQIGVCRVLSQARSGRDFLQSHAEAGGEEVSVSLFFETLKSARRATLCQSANLQLCAEVDRRSHDPLASFPELQGFDLYAGDGHYLQPAVHDERIEGDKHPVGHFYLLNLRSCALQHFALGLRDAATLRKSEHDMHALKRRGLAALRLGAPKGRKVLIVWDRAGIDFRHWHKAREHGVYFLSREKENMRLEVVGKNRFDPDQPCNEGVRRDELVATSQGTLVRRVIYEDAVSGVTYSYLTSNLKLAPGLLALLYKRRWDIEKAFDETENRFEEGKAWATSETAKGIQAQLICLAYNLCLLMERSLGQDEQIENLPELKRRAKRQADLQGKLAQAGKSLPFADRVLTRLTQRGAKLIRWIRNHLYSARTWLEATTLLRRTYARL